MTIRNAYEFALIELNKLKAPSMLIEDYVYLFNKAIQQYINLVYNRAEYNQQSSDDLSFLQTTHMIKFGDVVPEFRGNEKIWKAELPKDYIHMLNCIATFTGGANNGKVKRCSNLEDKSKTITSLCRRLTADIYPDVLRNYYLKPSYKNPYWYIINSNNSADVVTNENMDAEIMNGSSYKFTDTLENDSDNISEYRYIYMKDKGDRTVHQSPVNIEIHSGNDNWDLDNIYLTYIKAPMYVSMTEEDVLSIEDNTQNLEFPDYICYEIINLFVKLVMENMSDPRLQTNMPINQTIAIPGSK